LSSELDKEKFEKIGQLLRTAYPKITVQEIAKQVDVQVRKVYRHPAWKEVKSRIRVEEKKEQAPEPSAPRIQFEKVETPEPPPTPKPTIPEAEAKLEAEAAPAPAPTVPKLEKGDLSPLISTGLEMICEVVKLDMPNPVKIEKLDSALVNFFIAWNVNFGDPRILSTMILAGTVAEVALPMVKEYRAKPNREKEPKLPETTTEKALAPLPLALPIESNEELRRRAELATGNPS
jgi:hypothetical protein